MGIDPGEAPYEVRAQPVADAALFRTSGRGMGRPFTGITLPLTMRPPGGHKRFEIGDRLFNDGTKESPAPLLLSS